VLASTAASYLETLNPEQRRAVEHGITADGHVGAPLLVIAGAGSGKTNTLAHRVAHLIVSGADPRRILLMSFSRRTRAGRCPNTIQCCNIEERLDAFAGQGLLFIVRRGSRGHVYGAPPTRVAVLQTIAREKDVLEGISDPTPMRIGSATIFGFGPWNRTARLKKP
jgi:UvrD/REP helicase N-terminal domain